MKEREILNRWMKYRQYCSELHNHKTVSTELLPDRHRGLKLHPSQRSGGCSTITEEKGVSWSCQHPSRTGPSRWRSSNHCSHDNPQQDVADRRMANPMDPVLSHHTSQERQPTAVSELPNDQPYQPSSQNHAKKIILNRLKPQMEIIVEK